MIEKQRGVIKIETNDLIRISKSHCRKRLTQSMMYVSSVEASNLPTPTGFDVEIKIRNGSESLLLHELLYSL
jgi:hypothetical protein